MSNADVKYEWIFEFDPNVEFGYKFEVADRQQALAWAWWDSREWQKWCKKNKIKFRHRDNCEMSFSNDKDAAMFRLWWA